jgi:hypothetical protein
MQSLTLKVCGMAAAVQGISQQGVTNGGHMHSNLVSATSVQSAMHQAAQILAFQTPQTGVCGFAGLFGQVDHRHAQSLARIASDGCVYLAQQRTPPRAVSNGEVIAVDLPRSDHLHQSVHGGARTGGDHQTTGVLVQTVNYACAGNQLETWIQIQQTIEQSATPITWGRMHNHANGLVDNA